MWLVESLRKAKGGFNEEGKEVLLELKRKIIFSQENSAPLQCGEFVLIISSSSFR